MKCLTVPIKTVTLADIIGELNLGHYANVLMTSSGVNNGYHNARHALHVFMEVFTAIRYYEMVELTEIRPLLIAALLQDLNHPGTNGPDNNNIKTALAAIESKLLKPDKEKVFTRVSQLVKFTELPHIKRPGDLSCRILQDAELTQAFADTCSINELLFGLAREWGTIPNAEYIDGQIAFFLSIRWQTEWAKKRCSQLMIDAKIAELEQWKLILAKVK